MILSYYKLEYRNTLQHLCIFLILALFFQILLIKQQDSIQSLFTTLLVIGGMIYSQAVFKDVHQEKGNIGLMMLPGSLLEKVTHRWLISYINYFILFLLGFLLTNQLALIISSSIGLSYIQRYSPFNEEMLSSLKLFLTFHSLYFFGGLYFSKLQFIKSSLFILLFLLFINALLVFLFITLGLKASDTASISQSFIRMGYVIGIELPKLKQFFSIFFFIIVPIFFYIASFLRFRETEDKT